MQRGWTRLLVIGSALGYGPGGEPAENSGESTLVFMCNCSRCNNENRNEVARRQC